ncbi:MAG: hypothetical protein HFH37_11150 [Lachnospiraceae bacterium]|jgi:hypothetical protein|nr:hypothetical protein [Lachnospiraceae bacterium]
MTDKDTGRNPGNTYDDGNIPEIDLPGRTEGPSGQNRYGDAPIGDPGNHGENSSGESNLVWVTPPVLLAEAGEAMPNTAGGI